MDKIALTCLRVLTDSRTREDIEPAFKVLTCKFIKNVIMECGSTKAIETMQHFESTASAIEKAEMAKYMQKA